MGELGVLWRAANLNSSLQKYKHQPVPPGYKVLYAIVSLTGTEKAYIGKAGHLEKGAKYRIFGKGGHIQGPNSGRSAIHDAIVSNGWDTFTWFILALVPKDEVNNAEKAAIKKYNSLTETQGGNGYNIMKGGDGGEKTPEMIAKQKATMATTESKTKRSAISKKMWTSDYRAKMKGRNGWWPADREKRIAALTAGQQTATARKNHSEGSRKAWDKSRAKRAANVEAKRVQRAATAVPLPEKMCDRVHGSVYVVMGAFGRGGWKVGDVGIWRSEGTANGKGVTGKLKRL